MVYVLGKAIIQLAMGRNVY